MIIETILLLAVLYFSCGIVFAIAFILKGAGVVDEAVHGSSIGFKIIIIPGTIVFWPVLLKKWLKSSEKNHRD